MGFFILLAVAVGIGLLTRRLVISHTVSTAQTAEREGIQPLLAQWGFSDVPGRAEIEFRYRHLLALIRAGYATPLRNRQGLESSRTELENYLSRDDHSVTLQAKSGSAPKGAAFLAGGLVFALGIASDSIFDRNLTPADVTVTMGDFSRRDRLLSSSDGVTLHGTIQNRSSSTIDKVIMRATLARVRSTGAVAFIMPEEAETFSIREEIAPGASLRFSHTLDELAIGPTDRVTRADVAVQEVDAKGWLGIF